MAAILYGLCSALSWGAGDFTGGFISRRVGAYRAAFYAEAVGLVMLLAAAAVLREPSPPAADWAWSAAAGAIGALGLLILYRSLAEGQMSVAAPVSALTAAALPVAAGALTQGFPGFTRYVGFALALAAIWLVSQGEGGRKNPRLHLADLRLPLISGACFGIYFILMHRGSQEATLWPMVASRGAGTLVLFFFAAARGQLAAPGKRLWPLVALNAAGDIGGNTFYILAGQAGRLDMAAVLGSLYPGATVLLAAAILRERLDRPQVLGILAALGAIVLLTI